MRILIAVVRRMLTHRTHTTLLIIASNKTNEVFRQYSGRHLRIFQHLGNVGIVSRLARIRSRTVGERLQRPTHHVNGNRLLPYTLLGRHRHGTTFLNNVNSAIGRIRNAAQRIGRRSTSTPMATRLRQAHNGIDSGPRYLRYKVSLVTYQLSRTVKLISRAQGHLREGAHNGHRVIRQSIFLIRHYRYFSDQFYVTYFLHSDVRCLPS